LSGGFAIFDSQFLQNGVYVNAHGSWRDVEFFRNFLIVFAVREVADNIEDDAIASPKFGSGLS
jgi:hypothetical protein